MSDDDYPLGVEEGAREPANGLRLQVKTSKTHGDGVIPMCGVGDWLARSPNVMKTEPGATGRRLARRGRILLITDAGIVAGGFPRHFSGDPGPRRIQIRRRIA